MFGSPARGASTAFESCPSLPISVKQGLSSDSTHSVLAATDGSIWVAAHDGLTGGRIMDRSPSSARQMDCRTMWCSRCSGRSWTNLGVHGSRTCLLQGRQVCCRQMPRTPRRSVFHHRGQSRQSLAFGEIGRLLHIRDGRLVERFPLVSAGTTAARERCTLRSHSEADLACILG